MKKWIRLGLCTAVLAAALACTALAADGAVYGTGAVSYDGAKCSVTYSEGLTDGNQYVLLLVTDPDSINDEGVMYIDQAAAAGGQVSFAGFIPKDWPTDGQTWTALLGGEFTDGASPKTIGTLTFGEGVPVSGKVSLQGRSSHAGATVALSSADGASFTAQTGTDGSYTFASVAPGTYTMTITMPGYLSHTINSLAVNEPVTVAAKELLGGDISADGQVTIDDLNMLVRVYGEEAGGNAADINGNNQVEVSDLSLVLWNYSVRAAVEGN